MATMFNGPRIYGVTNPISDAPPTRDEELSTVALMEELRSRNIFESEEEARAREVVLGRLNALLKQFVIQVSMSLGMSEATARESGGKIFTFGSFRLGVHGPGADIDTLCVVPRQVTREHFFSFFHDMLAQRPEVTDLSPVPEAYVPILKLKFSGIEVDLLFARLSLSAVPDSLELKDDNLLKGLDDRCVRSLGGSRVTDQILRLVPNVNVFRDSLRAIKIWAKARGVNRNIIGFFGGVAWAMCVARVCQLYPNKPAATIVNRFFSVLSAWTWPSPVILTPIGNGPLGDAKRIWNPKIYPQDRGHRMPIITPAYPCMCSTHNVTKSTMQVMITEFKRGLEVTDEIVMGKKSWDALFEGHDFFTRYRYFLQITASSPSSEIQLRWSGTVEAKLRMLVLKIEEVETVDLAHPFVDGFDRVSHYLNTDEKRDVQIGGVPPGIEGRTPEDVAGKEGAGTVYTSTFYIGLSVQPKPVGSQPGPRKLDISYPVNEFTRLVKQWDAFVDETMGIVVRYIKSTALPDYVFGGSRPTSGAATTKGIKRTKTGKVKNSPTISVTSLQSPASTTDAMSLCSPTNGQRNQTTPMAVPTEVVDHGINNLPPEYREEDREPQRPDALKKRRPCSFVQDTATTNTGSTLTPPPPASTSLPATLPLTTSTSPAATPGVIPGLASTTVATG